MRTTLSIDDDLAAALKAAALSSGMTFKAVVNDAIRRGLPASGNPSGKRERFRVMSASRGFLPGVDPLKLNQLVDDLEVDDLVTQSHGTDRDAHSGR